MTCCRASQCEEFFKPATARRNLKQYLKKGLGAIERKMLGSVTSQDLDGASVLEIGGGIGAIQTELLGKGAGRGEVVELVSAYEPYAQELARTRGLENRSRFRVADVLENPAEVAPATIVVLNRVVCCSPDGVRLAGVAARLADRLLIMSFPRDRWIVRVFAATANSVLRLLGKSFRTFLHPQSALYAAAQAQGLRVAQTGRNFIWEFAAFRRAAE